MRSLLCDRVSCTCWNGCEKTSPLIRPWKPSTTPVASRMRPGGAASSSPSQPSISSNSRSSTATLPHSSSSSSVAGASPTAPTAGLAGVYRCASTTTCWSRRSPRFVGRPTRSGDRSAIGPGSSKARASRCSTRPELQAALAAWLRVPGGQVAGPGTGKLLRSATAPLRSHEMSRRGAIADDDEPGDAVSGDGGSARMHTWRSSWPAARTVCSACFRSMWSTCRRAPRESAREFDNAPALPHSRRVRARRESGQVVARYKPKGNPVWTSDQE